jgi:hypothetical protein
MVGVVRGAPGGLIVTFRSIVPHGPSPAFEDGQGIASAEHRYGGGLARRMSPPTVDVADVAVDPPLVRRAGSYRSRCDDRA